MLYFENYASLRSLQGRRPGIDHEGAVSGEQQFRSSTNHYTPISQIPRTPLLPSWAQALLP